MVRNNATEVAAAAPAQPSGALLILVAALLWSTTGIAGQMLPDVPPPTIGALRLVLGAAVLGIVILFPAQRTGVWSALSTRGRWLVVAAGGCSALFQVCFFGAVRFTGAALGTLTVLASAPVFAALIEWLIRRERPARTWYLGTTLAVGGVALLSLPGGEASIQVDGLVLAVMAGGCYAGYSNTTRELVQRGVPRTWVVRSSLTVGAILISPILLASDFTPLMNTRAAVVVGWLAVAGTVLPYLAFVAGLKYAAARTAATLGLAQPLSAAVLAVVVLHEPVTVPLAMAAALLIGGLVVVSWPARTLAESSAAVLDPTHSNGQAHAHVAGRVVTREPDPLDPAEPMPTVRPSVGSLDSASPHAWYSSRRS